MIKVCDRDVLAQIAHMKKALGVGNGVPFNKG